MTKPSDLKLTEKDVAEITSKITAWQTNKQHTINELKGIFSSVASHYDGNIDKGLVGKINEILDGLDLAFEEREIITKEVLGIGTIVLDGVSNAITYEQLEKLEENLDGKISYENKNYSLSVRNGNEWVYTAPCDDGGKINVIKINISTLAFAHSEIDVLTPTALTEHTSDTGVHLQTGERDFWNGKVKAWVVGTTLRISTSES